MPGVTRSSSIPCGSVCRDGIRRERRRAPWDEPRLAGATRDSPGDPGSAQYRERRVIHRPSWHFEDPTISSGEEHLAGSRSATRDRGDSAQL